MRRPRTLRAGGLVLLAAAAAPALCGCIHNHYYGTGVPTYSTTDLGPVTIGSVCEAPPRIVGGTVVSQAPAPAPTDKGAPAVSSGPAHVIVSEPARGPRLSWRRPDPEGGLATTRVDGGVDESVNR